MSKGFIKKESIFSLSEDRGYNFFRIPALVKSADGTILAFCEGRKGDYYQNTLDYGEIEIVLKKSYDNGKTWQDFEVIVSNGRDTFTGLCPFIDSKTKKIWLIYNCNKGDVPMSEILKGEEELKTYSIFSTDNGKTWSNPKEITDQIMKKTWSCLATGPCHAIQLKNESIIVPMYYYAFNKEVKKSYLSGSGVIMSEDHGESWKIGGIVEKKGFFTECSVVELANGNLILNMRDDTSWFLNLHLDKYKELAAFWEDCIYFPPSEKAGISQIELRRFIARSRDKGSTWQETWHDEQLADPCCQGSILRYTLESQHGKNRILFSNCDSPIEGERKNMSVKISYDECKSWQFSKVLHSGPSGYSDITVTSDNNIVVMYECGEKDYCERIDVAVFDLDWLTDGNDSI